MCVDAVTGSLSGVGCVCLYLSPIRASAGRERVLSVCLAVIISLGVCSALPPNARSGTITQRLFSL